MSSRRTSERSPLLGFHDSDVVEQQPASRRNRRHRSQFPYGFVALTLLICFFILLIIYLPHNITDTPDEVQCPDNLTHNIFSHLKALSRIAKHSKRHSRSITDGYNASAEYVINKLTNETNCDIKLQYFKAPIWEKDKEAELNVTFHDGQVIVYQGGVDFWSMRYGGKAASLRSRQVVEIQGSCDNETERDIQGKVVLIRLDRNCGVWDDAYNAEKAGAYGVIFYNSPGQKKLSNVRVRIVEWKEGDPLMSIPILAASNSLGQVLAKAQSVDIETYTKIFTADTYNVLCYLNNSGLEENTIVLGSHLDSVPGGPGLVDNASGSSTLLEILLTLERQQYRPRNRLVFAWWGAEEIGLGGSRHFVRELISSGESKNVSMNLNFDMLGSPNFIPFILRGSDAPLDARNGSIKIQNELERRFHRLKTSYRISDMFGGSDFLPFIQNGIPSGGLYTGSSEIKSRKSRKKFGGIANAPLDPCYHQSCDTLDNVSEEAINLTSKIILKSIVFFGNKKHLRSFLSYF